MGAGIAVACSGEERLRGMVDRHHDEVWLFLRRLGVRPYDVDDAMQEVLLVCARRMPEIQRDSERAFFYATAVRVASEWRRRRTRRDEIADDVLVDVADPGPAPDALADQRRARDMLERLLDELPTDQRAVFVLYEIEERTMNEIASLLDVPQGTVASRLRRGRDAFETALARENSRAQRLGRTSGPTGSRPS